MGIKLKRKQRSLAFEFSAFAILLIVLQSVLLVSALMLGGVLKQSRDNVYQSFQSKVNARAKFLQSEIDNRWTNFDPYVQKVMQRLAQEDVFSSAEAKGVFLDDAADTLIAMLRITGATGSFLVLDDDEAGDGSHSGLFFRTYEPTTNGTENKDLYMVVGPADLARDRRIAMDRTWYYKFRLNETNEAFFRQPFEAADLSGDYRKLLYWSDPFQLTGMDAEIITCSVPLFDPEGNVRGVMGVSILTEYFKKLLPASELAPQDSLGYLVAEVADDGTALSPTISKGSYQRRVLGGREQLQLEVVSREHNIYLLEDVTSVQPVYGCVQDIYFYRNNAPYETKALAVVGLMEQEKMMTFVILLQKILLFSFLGSLLFGATAGVAISRRMISPMVKLAARVRDYDYTENVQLEKTGLVELDELSSAIEHSGRNLLETTLKMSNIMELLQVPIAAFEYQEADEKVTVTNQLFELLNLPQVGADCLYVNREVFSQRLIELWRHPEANESNVFRAAPDKWLKVERMDREDSHLGVISDVTEEIREKHRIKQERDYDFLTRIYNRAAFQREVEQQLTQPLMGTTAMVMFDLDNLKGVNDTYGHEYGDIYIRTAAQRLAQMHCGNTVVGRRSGDEFFVFFANCTSRDAVRETVEAFYREVEQEVLTFPNGERYALRASSGVSWYGIDAFDYEELLRHADFAMYTVKQSGKGRMGEFYTEDIIRSMEAPMD